MPHRRAQCLHSTVVPGSAEKWAIGRIYETRGGPGSLRWFWSISLTPFATVATLEETEAQAL